MAKKYDKDGYALERLVKARVKEFLDINGIIWLDNQQGLYTRKDHRGQPDIVCFQPQTGLGVWIELKGEAPGKKARPEQREWIRRLNAYGSPAFVAKSPGEVCETLIGLGFQLRFTVA